MRGFIPLTREARDNSNQKRSGQIKFEFDSWIFLIFQMIGFE